MLVSVVFAGILGGRLEGVVVGLIAGLLRGCFSVGTFYLDLALFPVVGFLSSILAGKLFRFNPFVQMAVTVTMLFLVVGVHTSYLDFVTGSDISVLSTFFRSWRVVLTTALVAPIIFGVFGAFHHETG